MAKTTKHPILCKQAENSSTSPDRLAELARHTAPEVARLALRNSSVPVEAHLALLLEGNAEAWDSPLAPKVLLCSLFSDIARGARTCLLKCQKATPPKLAVQTVRSWWEKETNASKMRHYLDSLGGLSGQGSKAHRRAVLVACMCARSALKITPASSAILAQVERWAWGDKSVDLQATHANAAGPSARLRARDHAAKQKSFEADFKATEAEAKAAEAEENSVRAHAHAHNHAARIANVARADAAYVRAIMRASERARTANLAVEALHDAIDDDARCIAKSAFHEAFYVAEKSRARAESLGESLARCLQTAHAHTAFYAARNADTEAVSARADACSARVAAEVAAAEATAAEAACANIESAADSIAEIVANAADAQAAPAAHAQRDASAAILLAAGFSDAYEVGIGIEDEELANLIRSAVPECPLPEEIQARNLPEWGEPLFK